jgi:hypothetical protein
LDTNHDLSFVMPGLVPGIHVLLHVIKKDVDGRDKSGHDGGEGRESLTMTGATARRRLRS